MSAIQSTSRAAALRTPRTVAAALVLAVVAGVLGCRSTGDEPPSDAVFELSLVAPDENGMFADLAALQPADVFVAPVVDQSDAFATPTAELRNALYTGLVERLYSPVRLAWADEQLAGLDREHAPSLLEANAVLGADAILEVRLLAWDESALERDGLVAARVEARLVDPAHPDQPLWGYVLARQVDVGGPSSRRATRDVLAGLVAKSLAKELLALLPTRDARLAPR